jgi:hypothetical protein
MNSLRLSCVSLAAFALAYMFSSAAHAEDPDTGVRLRVSVLSDGIGVAQGRDSEWVGTKGQGRSIRGIEIAIDEPIPDLGIRYRLHVGNLGDRGWMPGFFNGQGKCIQGITIELTGAAANQYQVLYQGSVGSRGDTDVYKDGFFCGTRGLGLDLESIVVVVKKRK